MNAHFRMILFRTKVCDVSFSQDIADLKFDSFPVISRNMLSALSSAYVLWWSKMQTVWTRIRHCPLR